MGVDPAAVHLLPTPRDTGEEAAEMAELLQPGERFLLVTSAAHIPRAMLHFRARGLGPIPAPAQWYALDGPFSPRDLLPSGMSYVKVDRAVHEYLGLLWARMTVG